MVNPFSKILLCLAAASVAAAGVSAQAEQSFRDAVRHLRIGQRAEALKKLEEVLAANPSHEEAFRIWRETDAEIFHMLLAEQGEFQKIARSLMGLATIGRKEMSRDADAIAALIEKAMSDDYGERRDATVQLAAEHGEFAVPHLLKTLGDSDQDKGQDYAMLALFRIGHSAVLPLVTALDSDNEILRRNVAAALVHIGDSRAAPALARLAKEDSSESVRFVAKQGLDKFGLGNRSAVDLYIADARAYLTGGGVREGDHSDVVWSLVDGELVAQDVPAIVYHLELAKQLAHAAMRIDPANAEAEALLARSYLAQVAAIQESVMADPDNEAAQSLAASLPQLKMVAMATGPAVLRKALADSMSDRMAPVAVAAIEALGAAESRRSLADSPLVAALSDRDSRIAYAASLALANAAGGGDVPAAQKVVANLGMAVTEEAMRAIKVIDGNPLTDRAARDAGSQRGVAVAVDATAQGAIADFYAFPNYDVVVVSETLPDARPEDVISLIRKRNANAKILLLHTSDEAEERFADKVDGFLKGPLSGAALIEKANEVAGEIDPRRAAATSVAVSAGTALAKLARANVDISGALDNLSRQLDRDDTVAIPAANALGEGGDASSATALIGVLAGGGSAEVKSAAAGALGSIFARIGTMPAGAFDQMLALAQDGGTDVAVRSAIVTALGKARLAPGERLRLTDALRVIAGGSADGG